MKISKEECPRSINSITEDFSDPSEPFVTCTRCGAQSHSPALLCSPDVTLASSTPLRGSSSYSGSQSSFGESQDQSGFTESKGFSSQGSSNLKQSSSSLDEDIE